MKFRKLIFIFFLWVLSTPLQAEQLVTSEIIHNIEHLYQGKSKQRLKEWAKLIETETRLPERQKLEVVNRFFNKFEYRSDASQVGRNDFWMTPIEFISRGGGDCEDYAISKYFTLQAIGVEVTKLRITYVKYLVQNVAHMVLTYYETPSSMPLVLDNLINNIELANQRKDLVPVYSFNGDGLWLSRQREQGRRVSGSNKLSLWRDLNDRMLKQLQGKEKA